MTGTLTTTPAIPALHTKRRVPRREEVCVRDPDETIHDPSNAVVPEQPPVGQSDLKPYAIPAQGVAPPEPHAQGFRGYYFRDQSPSGQPFMQPGRDRIFRFAEDESEASGRRHRGHPRVRSLAQVERRFRTGRRRTPRAPSEAPASRGVSASPRRAPRPRSGRCSRVMKSAMPAMVPSRRLNRSASAVSSHGWISESLSSTFRDLLLDVLDVLGDRLGGQVRSQPLDNPGPHTAQNGNPRRRMRQLNWGRKTSQ